MKTKIPDELKADLPPSKWGKILSGTPVVLAVVATMLAGLSSSEMTKAQYDRSLAAQLQSKAGDQWSFFQAKRLRSALQNSTLDVIVNSAAHNPADNEAWRSFLAGKSAAMTVQGPASQQILPVLRDGTLPELAPPPPMNPEVQAALAILEHARPEAELVQQLAKFDDRVLEEAVNAARQQTLELDTLLKPIGQTIDAIGEHLDQPQTESAVRRNFAVARLRYNERRYDAEARLNQSVATLYELQVRKANLSAARRHARSQKFFYGMLAAQMGVIVSTLAIAARKRNLLWTVAAIAGVVAVAFAAYVYIFV